MKKAGEIHNYEIQHKIDLKVNGIHITNHYVDFLVFKPQGVVEFHEVKGYATSEWKIKRRLTEALFPAIPYIVKQGKNHGIWKSLSQSKRIKAKINQCKS